MKTKIELDLKSILIGAGATALIIFGTGASGSSTDSGPYVLKVADQGSAAVLNTRTGQVWAATIRPTDGQVMGTTGTPSFLTKKE